MREGRSSDYSRICNADTVMDLIASLQTAQDGNRILNGRLLHQYRLEAPLKGRVFFNVLAVLVQGGRANQVKLAARQHWLEHIAGVHGALGLARADDGVHLVHEQQDLPFRFGDLLQDRLQTLLKLAAVLRPGDQSAHIQLDKTLLLQAFRHIPVDDALRQPLDDRRFTDTRLTDQGRIVLCTTGQDLHHPADLLIPPDDRVQLALARHAGQVAPIFFQGLIRGLWIL